MAEQHKLLVIGPASPSRAIAAGICTQAALYFSSQIAVTLVISDYAPPATGFPDSISVIRERDLRQQAEVYLNAKRLYILDDNYESLFALTLLQEAPGPWITAAPTLHNLIHMRHKKDKAYPGNYFAYMEKSLGTQGWHIAHSLSGGTRVSDIISSEITSFDEVTNLGPQIAPAGDGLSLPLAPSISTKVMEIDDCFDIVTVGESIADEAINILVALGKKIKLHALTGSEPNLAAHLLAADAVCLLDKTHRLAPAALSLALDAGKVILTASQPWVRHLPSGTRLNIAHSHALHQLVAAIASLIGQSTVRPWLEENTKKHYQTLNTQAQYSDIAQQILSAPTTPLNLSAPKTLTPEHVRQKETEPTNAARPDLILDGQKKPYALVGAVPAQALVTQLFPHIDWDKSPRFATPDLAAVLCQATGKTAPVVLSLLGFESLLINSNISKSPPNNTQHMPKAYTWPEVQGRLKEIDSAITFDCDISELPKARALTPNDANIPGGLAIDFSPDVHEDINRQSPSGFLEKSGTYWQLNKIEHHIDCLLISGVPGGYKLSIGSQTATSAPDEAVAFMVTDDQSSNLLTTEDPAGVKTDAHGVIQFSLSAVHPVNHYPLTFKQLLETLARTPLYLEWCSHG